MGCLSGGGVVKDLLNFRDRFVLGCGLLGRVFCWELGTVRVVTWVVVVCFYVGFSYIFIYGDVFIVLSFIRE